MLNHLISPLKNKFGNRAWLLMMIITIGNKMNVDEI